MFPNIKKSGWRSGRSHSGPERSATGYRHLRKQRKILQSKVHLGELALQRAGEHSTAVPQDRLKTKAGNFNYYVCIHRFDKFEDYIVYPI